MVVDIDRVLVWIGCIVSTILFTTCIAGNVWVKNNATNSPSGGVVHVTDELSVSPTTNNNNNNSTDIDLTVMHYGIWKYCLQSDKVCYAIGDPYAALWKVTPTWLQGVRMLSCLAALLEAFGAVKCFCRIMRGTTVVDPNYSLKEPKICLMLGSLFMMVALSIFTAYIGPSPAGTDTWGWCFIVGWLGTCLTAVYGVFAIS